MNDNAVLVRIKADRVTLERLRASTRSGRSLMLESRYEFLTGVLPAGDAQRVFDRQLLPADKRLVTRRIEFHRGVRDLSRNTALLALALSGLYIDSEMRRLDDD
jgi:hypothetical protein